jgi:hypothetical protein
MLLNGHVPWLFLAGLMLLDWLMQFGQYRLACMEERARSHSLREGKAWRQ